jgi:hypothetical protein
MKSTIPECDRFQFPVAFYTRHRKLSSPRGSVYILTAAALQVAAQYGLDNYVTELSGVARTDQAGPYHCHDCDIDVVATRKNSHGLQHSCYLPEVKACIACRAIFSPDTASQHQRCLRDRDLPSSNPDTPTFDLLFYWQKRRNDATITLETKLVLLFSFTSSGDETHMYQLEVDRSAPDNKLVRLANFYAILQGLTLPKEYSRNLGCIYNQEPRDPMTRAILFESRDKWVDMTTAKTLAATCGMYNTLQPLWDVDIPENIHQYITCAHCGAPIIRTADMITAHWEAWCPLGMKTGNRKATGRGKEGW